MALPSLGTHTGGYTPITRSEMFGSSGSGAVAGIAGLQSILGIAKGVSQKGLYELQAKQAGLDAKAMELERRSALQDALAMQAVISAAGGRAAGVGSLKAIREEDIRRADQDVEMLKAGGKAKETSLKSAGKTAQYSSITSGLLSASQAMYQAKQVK